MTDCGLMYDCPRPFCGLIEEDGAADPVISMSVSSPNSSPSGRCSDGTKPLKHTGGLGDSESGLALLTAFRLVMHCSR